MGTRARAIVPSRFRGETLTGGLSGGHGTWVGVLGDHPQTNDRLANESHAAFAIQVDLYDCRKWYSLWTCTDCIAAYKAWVCATMFRNCENGTTLPVCRSLCFDGTSPLQ